MGTSPSQVDLSPPHQLAKLFGCGSRDCLVDPVLSVGLKLQGCAFAFSVVLFSTSAYFEVVCLSVNIYMGGCRV